MSENSVEVKCYSGHTYAERPESFKWLGVEYQVDTIDKSWKEPEGRHFHVRTKDNKKFHLYYNEKEKRWFLVQI